MNSKLKALVAFLGVVAVGSGAVLTSVYVQGPGVSMAELRDAGLDDEFNRRDRICQFYGDACPDGGYCRITIPTWRKNLPDGGREMIYRRKHRQLMEADEAVWCKPDTAPTLEDDEDEPAAFDCACRGGNQCKRPDGGPTIRGITYQPGEFVPHAECIPKPCVELFGVSSWPAECPGG